MNHPLGFPSHRQARFVDESLCRAMADPSPPVRAVAVSCFGYLLPTLMAVRMHQHREVLRVVVPVLVGLLLLLASPLSVPLGRYGLGKLVEGERNDLLLLPSTHGTDGFYVARLRRKG